ncbi:isomerase [Lithospermum erythrorhizon]|uniref:Isomerase n=1 Tax=Lithospermum erythrorhizon TaxID=34254 RepID=A0AAV3NJ15_LITER
MDMQEAHPYIPKDLQLSGYVPIGLSQSTIVGVYLLCSVLVVSFIWMLSGRCRNISKVDRLLMCWWVFTGLTHMVLEGYFVFSPNFYREKVPRYLAEVWKEYSKGDSRYVARDSAVIAVEGITVVLEGPACILAAYAIGGKKSYSYLLQLAISLGQLYGTIVYFVTAFLEGDNFAVSPFYYYSYYVFANGFWILVPTMILIRCWKRICTAVRIHEQKKTKASKD